MLENTLWLQLPVEVLMGAHLCVLWRPCCHVHRKGTCPVVLCRTAVCWAGFLLHVDLAVLAV